MDKITRIGLYYEFSGPAMILLNHGPINSFSLLPPETNNADIEVLTQNVVLSTNLVGRWQKPDNSIVLQNDITFPIFYLSDEGLYKFYVNSWDGDQTLAVQINILTTG